MYRFATIMGLCAVLCSISVAAHATCTEYFDDQRFTLVVPFGAGGGYDAYARAFAPVFEDLTGARLQVVNVTGGGGIIGAGRIATARAKDRTFGFMSSGRANAYQIEVPGGPGLVPLAGVLFEYEVWIAAADADLHQLMETGLVAGGSSLYSGITDSGLAAKALGVDLSLVPGYDGSAESSAAILRGEVDVAGRSASSALKSLETGEFKILLTITDARVDGLNVPALGELAAERAKSLSPDERAIRMKYARLAPKMTQNMRAFWASADLAPDVLACLTGRISDVVESDAYRTAAAAIKRAVNPIAQADAETFFHETLAAFKESGPLIEAMRLELE